MLKRHVINTKALTVVLRFVGRIISLSMVRRNKKIIEMRGHTVEKKNSVTFKKRLLLVQYVTFGEFRAGVRNRTRRKLSDVMEHFTC